MQNILLAMIDSICTYNMNSKTPNRLDAGEDLAELRSILNIYLDDLGKAEKARGQLAAIHQD